MFILWPSLVNAQSLEIDDSVWYVDFGDDASCPMGTFAKVLSREDKDLKHFYIDYEMCGHFEEIVHHGLDEYIKITIPGLGVFSGEGIPSLPSQGAFVPIPLCASPILVVANISEYSFDLNKPVFPGQPEQFGTDLVPPQFTISKDAYTQDINYPGDNRAEIIDTGIGVDGRRAFVVLNPVFYNPVTGVINFVHKMEVDIDLTNELFPSPNTPVVGNKSK